VPRGDAAALAEKIVWIVDHPDERARLAAAARISGQRYDISVFVRKMERLYTLLHQGLADDTPPGRSPGRPVVSHLRVSG
jgi:glycosyltransferase involved in cell wall biosynthesis